MCLHVSLSSPPSVRVFHPDITVMADWALKDNFHSVQSVCLFVCLCLPLFIPTGTYSQKNIPPKPGTYPTLKTKNVPYSQSQQPTPKSWPLTPKARNLLESQDLTPPPHPQTGNLLPKPATYPQSQQLTSETTRTYPNVRTLPAKPATCPQSQEPTLKARNLPPKPGIYPKARNLPLKPQSQDLTP